MPKPLITIPPSSSVAKLLEPGVGAAAMKPAAPQAGVRGGGDAGPREPAPAGTPEPTGEAADVKRELTLTRTTDRTLDDLVAIYQRATGARVHASHVMRALLRALRSSLPEVERAAAGLGPIRRPSNAPGREAERDAFEIKLSESLLAGLRAGGGAG
jgi:hypothetical protein